MLEQITLFFENFSFKEVLKYFTVSASIIGIIVFLLGYPAIKRFGNGLESFGRIILLSIKIKIFKKPKHVYIYTDSEKTKYDVTKDLVDAIKARLKEDYPKFPQYEIDFVENSEDLLWIPKQQFLTQAIIVIITDVSLLSCDKTTRIEIQNDLLKYAEKGGTLILGHDVLYRRVKNTEITKALGCSLTKFERRDKFETPPEITIENSNGIVEYEINRNLKNSELPESFKWRDREVVISEDWVKQYIEETDKEKRIIPIYTEKKTGYVLVVKKPYEKGSIFWINCGDHTGDGPPPSLINFHCKFNIVHLLKGLIENKDLELIDDGKIDPQNLFFVNTAVKIFREQEKLEKAEQLLREAMDFSMLDKHLQHQLGLVLKEIGIKLKNQEKFSEAVKYLQESTQYPNLGDLSTEIADVYIQWDKLEKAELEIEKFIGNKENNLSYLVIKAEILRKQKKFNDSNKILQKALTISKSDLNVYKTLVELRIDQSRNAINNEDKKYSLFLISEAKKFVNRGLEIDHANKELQYLYNVITEFEPKLRP